MNRAQKIALKTFAKRHHLHYQTDRLDEEILPLDSVFKHNLIQDEAIAIGSVGEMDIFLTQRSAALKTPGHDRRHLDFTLIACKIAESIPPLLYVGNNVPAAYALTIKHLRNAWPHHHFSQGALFVRAHHGELPGKVTRALESAGDLSVEIQDQFLIMVTFPAINSDSNLEELLTKFKAVKTGLKQ